MVEYDEIFKAMESFEMQAEWLAVCGSMHTVTMPPDS
jgi:hypothetical protein